MFCVIGDQQFALTQEYNSAAKIVLCSGCGPSLCHKLVVCPLSLSSLSQEFLFSSSFLIISSLNIRLRSHIISYNATISQLVHVAHLPLFCKIYSLMTYYKISFNLHIGNVYYSLSYLGVFKKLIASLVDCNTYFFKLNFLEPP